MNTQIEILATTKDDIISLGVDCSLQEADHFFMFIISEGKHESQPLSNLADRMAEAIPQDAIDITYTCTASNGHTISVTVQTVT